MQMDVDTQALGGVAAGIRSAAGALAAVDVPAPVDLESVAASDAVRMLLRVVAEQRDGLAHALETAAVLVETAAVDYARTESQASR